MKIKDLKIFKEHFEKKEQLKLQKKQEFVAKIKKEWTRDELIEVQVRYMLDLYYNNFGRAQNGYMPCEPECLDEFELKYYLVHLNENKLSEDEIIDLLNDIKKQKTKKKNI